MQQTSKTLFRELDRLKAIFAGLSGRLDDAGKQFRRSGVPLPENLVSELSDFNKGLEGLGNRVLELGQELSLPKDQLAGLPVAALDSLDRALRLIAEVEGRREKATAGEGAIAVVDRISCIARRDRSIFPPLLQCQARAKELRNQIITSPSLEVHPAVREFTESRYAFSSLLCLIENQTDLTDEECLNFQEIVAESFGKDLAIAALRGTLEVRTLPVSSVRLNQEGSVALPLKQLPQESSPAGLLSSTLVAEQEVVPNNSPFPSNADVEHAVEDFLRITASEVEASVMEILNLQQIADLYREQNKYSLAEPLYKNLLEAQQNLYGAQDPRVYKTRQTLEAIHIIQEGNALPKAISKGSGKTRQKEAESSPRFAGRTGISRVWTFVVVIFMLSYAMTQHWPMTAEALLQHLESLVSRASLSMSHAGSTDVRGQPRPVVAEPQVTPRQMARTAAPPVRITRKAVDPPEETPKANKAAQSTVLTKDEPEPPRLSAFVANPHPNATATGNSLISPPSSVIAALPPPEHPPLERIRVGGQVATAKLVVQTKPIYPPLALRGRIEGRVRLEAVIDRDGVVENLKLVSGNPLLSSAASLAVKQWRYQPTLLNGAPVEVVTTVDVDFRLPN